MSKHVDVHLFANWLALSQGVSLSRKPLIGARNQLSEVNQTPRVFSTIFIICCLKTVDKFSKDRLFLGFLCYSPVFYSSLATAIFLVICL